MSYQSNHVDHGRISRHKQEKSDLHGVGLFNVPGYELLGNKAADEVVLGLLEALIHKLCKILEQLPNKC
jgi:hypothetical protein